MGFLRQLLGSIPGQRTTINGLAGWRNGRAFVGDNAGVFLLCEVEDPAEGPWLKLLGGTDSRQRATVFSEARSEGISGEWSISAAGAVPVDSFPIAESNSFYMTQSILRAPDTPTSISE
jgi:hypothetical protein